MKSTELVPGVVSVVVLNYKGADDTIACLEELIKLDLPADRLDLICVDNASGDGSFEKISAAAPPSVRVVASPVNGGFTGGCNFGAALARGEYLAFINNDARPDRAWLSEAIRALASDSTVGCVASKVLDWDGVNVDFTDAALAWYGMGYKPGAGQPDDGTNELPKDVLFATGSAMVTRTDLYRELDGFDERFFMFYEDVDFGWRLNILGHRVRYVPTSLVFHKHHASMKSFGSYREWYLLERNALLSLYKNAQDSTLQRLLAPALALSVRRGLATGGVDIGSLDLARSTGDDSVDTIEISKQGLTGAFAVDYFVDQLPTLSKTRADLQRRRVRTDREIMPLMRKALEPAIPNERYLAGHQALVDAFRLDELFQGRTRILVVTGDPLSAKMAGPGIRAMHIAESLSAEHEVRLISTTSCSIEDSRFECLERPTANLKADVKWAEVVIFQGFLLYQIPWLAKTDKVLVADLYDPMHLEQLEQTRGDEPISRALNVASTTEVLNEQLRRGDFFLCASEKQRHFWLGQLAAVGRLNPRTYDRDSTLASLVAVVPFGLPDEAPIQERSPIKGGDVAGIGPDDKVILWAGGIYNWFDPISLLRAVAKVAEQHPDVRLYFLGTQHPNALVPKMRMVERARALSDGLGLTNKHVFFNSGWVEYSDRKNYLLDADLGVSTHFEHIETTFSFRTRILDYLWAGLPVVVTEGDNFGDLVRQEQLGVAVPEQDVDALAAALEKCLYDEDFVARCRENVRAASERFQWTTALAPLINFCRAPERAPDAESTGRGSTIALTGGGALSHVGDLALARQYLAEGGLGEVARRAAGRLRRRVRGSSD